MLNQLSIHTTPTPPSTLRFFHVSFSPTFQDVLDPLKLFFLGLCTNLSCLNLLSLLKLIAEGTRLSWQVESFLDIDRRERTWIFARENVNGMTMLIELGETTKRWGNGDRRVSGGCNRVSGGIGIGS